MSSYLLVTGDFVKTGGMDRANFALASYLARQGDDVHLVAFRADDALLAMPNVTLHRVAKPLNSYTLALPLLARAGRQCAYDIAARGGRIIVNGGATQYPDVNWVHYVHAAFEPRFDSLPRRVVGSYNHHHWLRDERQALRGARTIFANSNRTRRDLVERIGIDADRVHVVYYGIDPQQYRPANDQERAGLRQRLQLPMDRKVVLFVGAMSDRRKGFDTLFEAWQRLDADALLCVVGAGSDVRKWERRARAASLRATSPQSAIRFLGHRNDVADLLRAADLLVSPTRYEAYGLAVHEAVCCGTPAIVSADAGVAERFPASLKHLLLDDPNDVDGLVLRLRRCLDATSAELRDAVRSFSGELRQRSWDDMAAEMVGLLNSDRQERMDTRPRPVTVNA